METESWIGHFSLDIQRAKMESDLARVGLQEETFVIYKERKSLGYVKYQGEMSCHLF